MKNTKNNMSIRKMSAADIPEVSALLAALHRTHREFRPDIYIKTDKPFAEADLVREIDNPDRIIIIAECESCVAGFCMIINKTPQNPLCINRKIAFIEAIYVREDMRRRGIGGELYATALEKAKNEGSDSIELMVSYLNKTALRFYERMGMKIKSSVMETRL